MSKSQEKIIEILRIIEEYDKPVGARIVAKELKNRGYDLGERTIRYHMQILDEKGYTQRKGYSGRILTSLGKAQLKNGLIYDHVDFVFSKFEELIYQTNLDEKNKKGNVVINVSKVILDEDSLKDEKNNPIAIMKKAFSSGLAVSPLVDIEKKKSENSKKNEFIIKTICGTTIDGMLLKNGIPSLPIYGGLLKVEDYVPQRFTELISYKKTSITPINAFVADGMTSILNVLEDGNGIIPANFRVIPTKSLEKAKKLFDDLAKIGINGIVSIGESGEKVLGINVNENFSGIAIIGGITPLCILKEMEKFVEVRLADELSDFEQQKLFNSSITNKGILKNYEGNKNSNKKDKKIDTVFKNSILKPSAKEKELKVSFLLSKAWNLMQDVDFDIETHEGNLIGNLSYVNKDDLDLSINHMKKAYRSAKKYISPYYKIVEPKKDSAHYREDKIGIATICSLSFDGILIKKGIMSTPKYGGLLELGNTPLFTELISYDGSSIDPHEIFIFKNMTSINRNPHKYDSITDENEFSTNFKKILASIKEVPFIAREQTKEILNEMGSIKLPIFKIGKPRELVYNAKVDTYNFGFVTGSGLNPIAAIKENGIDVDFKTIQGNIQLDNMDTL